MKSKIVILVVLLVIGGAWYTMRAGGIENAPSDSAVVAMDEVKSGEVSVSIKGYAFLPAKLKVKKGSVVTWTNEDLAKHSIQFADGSVAGPLFGQGERFAHTFDTTGTFAYACGPHPYMKAEVEVIE